MGPLLSFKEKYLSRVLSGEKRATIRLGVVRPRFQLVYITCCGMIYGEAVITGVQYAKLKELGSEVLREDGFNSLEEALEELKSLYPKIEPDSVVSVLRFALLRKYEKPVPLEVLRKKN
jgi:hypothetical protein